jgi:hypothetical protein
MLPRLGRRQRLSYALLQPYYPFAGLQWLLSVALTSCYMATGARLGVPAPLWAAAWLASVGSTLGFWFWTRRFNLTEPARRASGLAGLGLALVTIPVHASAAIRWLTGRSLPYIVTGKGALSSPDTLRAFRPHLAWLGWDSALLALGGLGVLHVWPLILFWCTVSWLICAAPVTAHLVSRRRRGRPLPPAPTRESTAVPELASVS